MVRSQKQERVDGIGPDDDDVDDDDGNDDSHYDIEMVSPYHNDLLFLLLTTYLINLLPLHCYPSSPPPLPLILHQSYKTLPSSSLHNHHQFFNLQSSIKSNIGIPPKTFTQQTSLTNHEYSRSTWRRSQGGLSWQRYVCLKIRLLSALGFIVSTRPHSSAAANCRSKLVCSSRSWRASAASSARNILSHQSVYGSCSIANQSFSQVSMLLKKSLAKAKSTLSRLGV